MIVNILILFFIMLLIFQFSLQNGNFRSNIEGLTTATILSPKEEQLKIEQKNAGNIDVLKKQVEKLLPLNGKVQDLSGNVTNLSQQINSLIQTQQQYAESVSSIKV